ncbi:phytanoyl-CoA dioxygenase family protein [Aurantiacibacter xanthus]|uniref:Phytanoyl-CoA dioxygenase family protein n=1 Tax=Aurantiacibacter xanthus TaxID=1784712 RepID=A0A3A1PGL9_9SPHN|nr:phytanoyl-CoA dioxygenase family protein [Aurantiacibacter xanthus]RIV92742.1 phytanoyl-CoA dioxygenase family protein [Aurantiacibacter xanthus]
MALQIERASCTAHHWQTQLRIHGYCVVQDLVSPVQVAALNADLAPQFAATEFCRGDFYGERTKRFGRLLTRSQHASAFVQHPLIIDLVERALGAWCDTIQLNLTQAIEIHPGALRQVPHRDQDMWEGVKGEVEYLVNVMWPLTPYTQENGATLVYPGSQGSHALDADQPTNNLAVEMVPGSALIFLGSTLHGAGGNRTDKIRRGLIVSYSLGWLKPYENQWLAYPPEVARHFSPELAALVGYRQHRPNLGNWEGLCPSVLLGERLPDRIGAVDALRPDQEEMVGAFRRSLDDTDGSR